MKNLLLPFLAALAFSSCKNNDDPVPAVPVPAAPEVTVTGITDLGRVDT